MPTTLTNGIQLPDKGSVDWYSSMQSNYNLIDTHLGNTDTHVTAEDKANWNSKQGSLSQAQLDAIAQVATNTSDIATLQSGKANASHTHSSSDITDIGDYATKQYVDNSISGLVDNAPAALDTLKELSTALNDDANFATTVTNALSAKANSADLATVATSGDYDDLSNKPSINDSTITIQKNGSTVDTFTTNGSAKTINIPVPTKTSDLTNDSDFVVSSSLATVATSGFYNDLDNKPYIPDKISDLIDDSNFVDTSNPAVSSGITSAKVTDYDTHIADTDIHVTTSDKTTWNTVTSKAQDSDVVHRSGDETVGGIKTFSDVPVFKSFDGLRFRCVHNSNAYITFRDANQANPGSLILSAHDGNVSTAIHLVNKTLIPYITNDMDLGITSRKWKSFNGINPGSLSLPDLSNGIDISSYITVNGGNKESLYMPPANGWISVRLLRTTSGAFAVLLIQGGMASSGRDITNESGTRTADAMLPVKGGVQVSINSSLADGIAFAYFYPCQGNV